MMSPVNLVLLLLLLSAVSAASGCCPDLWTNVGNKCYKVSPGPLTWHSAQQYCVHEGGRLAEIHDEATQASLPSFLNTNTIYWIGLTDLARDGRFVWQSDFSEPTYTNWRTGEPNNFQGDEDCVHLREDLQWNDHGCSETYLNDASGVARDFHALCQTENYEDSDSAEVNDLLTSNKTIKS